MIIQNIDIFTLDVMDNSTFLSILDILGEEATESKQLQQNFEFLEY
jgi:hypothetical protein